MSVRVFLDKIRFELVGSAKQITLPLWWAYPIPWRHDYNTEVEEEEIPPLFPALLLELGHSFCFSPALGLGFTPLATLVLRLHAGTYTCAFQAHPDCRWQSVGLLSSHNCASQFLIMNLSLGRQVDRYRPINR